MPEKNVVRCPWCGTDPLYMLYHDQEWGRPVYEDRVMHEFLVLESAQAGLSWITILRKRENYRKAFKNFDPEKIAAFKQKDVDRLMNDPGIVRNKLKINAAISNSRLFLDLQKEFGSFCDYFWGFLPDGRPIVNHWTESDRLPATTELSDRISLDMKKRGFKFFGSTICYAHLQATGLVNDHIATCSFRNQ